MAVLLLTAFAVVPGTVAASQGATYEPGDTTPDEYTVWVVDDSGEVAEVIDLTDTGSHLNVTRNGEDLGYDVVDRMNTSALISHAAFVATAENHTIVVGPGEYNVSAHQGTWWTGPVDATADAQANVTRIVADGEASGETVLQAAPSGPSSLLTIADTDADAMAIENVSFRGHRSAGTGVRVATAAPDADVELSNVSVNATTGSGLWIGLSLDSLSVDDSTFSYNRRVGIGVDDPSAVAVTLTDSAIHDNGGPGIYLENTTGTELRNVTVARNNRVIAGGVGVHLNRTTGTELRNSTIAANGPAGLYVENSSDVAFEDNVVREDDRWAVEIDGDSSNVTVRDLDLGASTAANTTVSFEARNASVGAQPSPRDPHHLYDESLESVGRYAESIVHDGGYLNLTIHYAEDDTDVTSDDEIALWADAAGERWGKIFDASTDTDARTVAYNLTFAGRTVTFGVFEDTTAALKGTVQDQSGTGIDGATVFVHDKGFQNRIYNGNLDDGEFDLALPPGTYNIEGDADGNATAMERDVELSASGSRTVDLQVPPAAYIEGYVNAADGGTVSKEAGVLVNTGEQFYFSPVDASGTYELEVPAGTHNVVGFDPKNQNMTADVPQVTVEAGERVDDGSVTNITLVNPEVRNANVTIVEGPGDEGDLALRHGLQPPVFMGVALVNGSAPSDDPAAQPPADLSELGVDETTRFRIEFTVDGFEPDSLMWGARDVEWDTEPNAAGSGTNVTVNASAVHLAGVEASKVSGTDQVAGPLIGNELEQINWPAGADDTAPSHLDWNETVYFGMLDTAAMPPDFQTQLGNVSVTTNAQLFTTPQVSDERLRVYVAGPGTLSDGSNHTGFYRAFVPDRLLSEWGVEDPATELDVLYKGDSRNFDVQVVDDGPRGASGAWIEITDIGYSDGVIDVEPQPDSGGDDSSSTSPGGSTGSGSSTSSTSSSDDSTDGEDGGDALISAELTVAEDVQQLSDAEPDRAGVQVQFDETETVEALSFDDDGVEGTHTVAVAEGERLPAEVSAPADEVEAAVEIDVPTEVEDEPATIRFRIDAADVEDGPEDITLQRYDDGTDTWTELETRVVEGGDDVVWFEADTPGLSLFAVTERTGSQATDEPVRESETPTPETATPETASDRATDAPTTTAASGQPGFGVVAAALALLAVTIALRRRG